MVSRTPHRQTQPVLRAGTPTIKAKSGTHGMGKKMHGKGRVFYSAMGHVAEPASATSGNR